MFTPPLISTLKGCGGLAKGMKIIKGGYVSDVCETAFHIIR